MNAKQALDYLGIEQPAPPALDPLGVGRTFAPPPRDVLGEVIVAIVEKLHRYDHPARIQDHTDEHHNATYDMLVGLGLSEDERHDFFSGVKSLGVNRVLLALYERTKQS